MSEPVITDEAVDAFRQGYLDYRPNPDTDNPRAHWRAALAAAAPLIQADRRTDSEPTADRLFKFFEEAQLECWKEGGHAMGECCERAGLQAIVGVLRPDLDVDIAAIPAAHVQDAGPL